MNSLRMMVGGCLIGATSVVFVISFAAIVFSGSLTPFLDRAIGLTLIGASIMSLMGAFLFSYRGTVAQPQDVTAIVLAGGAASLAGVLSTADPDALYATLILFIAVAAMVSGVAAIAMGTLRLSFIARFLPYPVLGGFLAATGYYLVSGAIGMTSDASVGLASLPDLLGPERLAQWVPWIAAGAIMVLLSHRFEGDLILPLSVFGICGLFAVSLWLRGLSFTDAEQAGLLLGPFSGSGFVGAATVPDLSQVRWSAILGQGPIVLVVAAMTSIGGLLNVIALDLVRGEDSDLDGDLKAIGWTNLGASTTGCLVGYPLLAETVLATRFGMTGAIAGISAALVCALTALFGAGLLGLLPTGLFAAVIAYLGIDLLYRWLWIERQRLPLRDYAIVLLTLGIAAAIGFLQALAFGVAASILLFIASYARLSAIRSIGTMALRRSMLERPAGDLDRLADVGDTVLVVELTGYLFFGTAAQIRNEIRIALGTAGIDVTTILLDFRRVSGIDTSAIQSLIRLCRASAAEGQQAVFSGLQHAQRAEIERTLEAGDPAGPIFFDTLEDALQHLEDQLLGNANDPDDPAPPGSFLASLAEAFPTLDLNTVFEPMDYADGDPIIAQGDASREMYVLLSGHARASIDTADGSSMTVARFLPGALVGEIAYYGGTNRSASVIAEGPTRALRIDPARLATLKTVPPGLDAEFHRIAARHLSRRLFRSTRLIEQSLR